MHNNSNPDRAGRRERLATLAVSGASLALLIAAGYYAPALLAAALH